MTFAVIAGVFHRLRPRALTAEQLRPPAGLISGGRMLACRKWGQQQTGYWYLSIPSGSCYCRPTICALVPFPTCRTAHSAPCRWCPRKTASDQTSIPECPVATASSRETASDNLVRLRMSVEIGLGRARWTAAREYERKPAALPVSAERGAGG